MLRVLRNPAYATLFSAQVLALLGTGLLTVALGLLAYDLAGAAAGAVLGTALTIKMVAYVGVAPPIAALVDRMPKKLVLVTADVVRFAVALTLPFVTEVWQIYVLVFVLQSASATFTPAFQSLIPVVLPDAREYTRALSLSRLAYDLEALVSPTIAAALLTIVPFTTLFAGTAAGFAASAVLVLVTRLRAAPTAEQTLTFWQRLPLGVQVFARTPTLRFLLWANVAVAAATALVLVDSVVYARGLLGLDDAALATTLAAYGLGSLAVAFAVPALVDRLGVVRTMSLGMLVLVAGLAAALPVTLVAETGTGWPALLATWVVLGVGTSLVNTPSARLLADAATAQTRNLVYTAQFALSHACFLVTYPIAGWLGAVSLPVTVAALGALAAVATAFALARARRLPASASTGQDTVQR
ncbi:MFS transporter [Microbacterium sp.]|uniref:MFS transporter n=1 Tax=Microbacterium sp. TaxID=51671 RepID=UPI003A83BD88